ncbi:MAG: tetratricopeptide repeat protein [bacterium]
MTSYSNISCKEMHCPHCYREIEKGLLYCPHCGGETNSPLEDCLDRALKLIEEEKNKEAMDFLKEVVARFPQSASAHSLLASLYEEAKDYPSAIRHYRQAVELNPQSEAEKRKLELLTGEKFTPSRIPLLQPALVLLGILFIVLIISSIPRKKASIIPLNNQLTNQFSFPFYNQPQMFYPYYSNLPQSENVATPLTTSPTPSPEISRPPIRKTPTNNKPIPENRSGEQQFPTTNIIIQQTSPPPIVNQPTERKSKIFVSVKKVPPSFEELYSQGIQKQKEKDFLASERLLRQALELAPRDKKGEIHLFLAISLKELGRLKEARDEFASAEQLLASRNDPYSQQLLQLAKEGRRFCEERL